MITMHMYVWTLEYIRTLENIVLVRVQWNSGNQNSFRLLFAKLWV